jgi:predicted nucleic acid-binding protein
VSAAITGGNPQRVLDLASTGALRLVACPFLLEELAGVLAREKFLRWGDRAQFDRFLADVRGLADMAGDPTDVPAVTRDRNDDYLVALARAAHADAICSGDGDLTAVAEIEVLTPAELLARFIEHD